MASRYHPTGTMALAYGLAHPKLLIQGLQASIPGVNPKALSGQTELAYKAIIAQSYGNAAKVLKSVRANKNVSPEDAAAAEAMTGFVNERFKEELAALEAFEKRKDFFGLSTAFLACKKTYSVLDDFKEKTQRFEDALKQPEQKAEIKLGGRYAQMMTTLKKTQSKTALTNLERFAEDNPESIYGKWAATVVKKYREEDVVVDPSTEEPPPAEEKSIPAWAPNAEL
jgi:hypothetical protein